MTIEADRGDQEMADAINEALKKDGRNTPASLQRQLANDEPKCANCRYWDQVVEVPHLGGCLNIKIGNTGHTSSGKEFTGQIPVLADLSVCSRWEAKGDIPK